MYERGDEKPSYALAARPVVRRDEVFVNTPVGTGVGLWGRPVCESSSELGFATSLILPIFPWFAPHPAEIGNKGKV
jgi:hypothetical protein